MFLLKDLLVSVLSPDVDPEVPFPPSVVEVECPQSDDPAQMVQFIADLKKQLKKVLDRIADDPETICEQLRPQTVERVELLERKFKHAQDELKRLKIELSGQ